MLIVILMDDDDEMYSMHVCVDFEFFHAIKYFILCYDVIEGGDDIFLDRLSNL